MKEENPIFYYPCCSEIGCDGIQSVAFDENNYSLNCECEKNNLHNKKNIYYKTFEKFYIKELKTPQCSKCGLYLENDLRYKCKKCEKIYCNLCLVLDEHIRDNNKNILLIDNKCSVHKKDLTLYCKDCHKHLCMYCVDDSEDNIHYKHSIENLYKIKPSTNKIDKIKKQIIENKKLFEEYFSLINDWKIKINNQIELLYITNF